MHANFGQIRLDYSMEIPYLFSISYLFSIFEKKDMSHTEFQIRIEHEIFVFLET